MNRGLSGRRALVTGGSAGIGFATADRLAAEGVNLALVARSEDRLSAACTQIAETHGVDVVHIVADLSQPNEPGRVVEHAAEALGGLDILVNNAGSSPFGSLEAVSDSDWMSSIDLKLMGYVRCTRAAFGIMKDGGGGVIVNVVGMAGRSASPAYVLGSLNAALLHFTKSVAELGGPHGIRVMAVNPGLTTTDRMEEAIEVWAEDAGMTNEEFRTAYLDERVPLRRFTTPEDVAEAIAYLCSDTAAPVTGSAIDLDGASSSGVF
ncbi:MAG: SDR family oxidoreductase [bacterium]|nr:SDR family oxidoreductase [bacterium]MDE0601076.1 SDR family oxidoreductase [bacterium]